MSPMYENLSFMKSARPIWHCNTSLSRMLPTPNSTTSTAAAKQAHILLKTKVRLRNQLHTSGVVHVKLLRVFPSQYLGFGNLVVRVDAIAKEQQI
jgi:hypothetical protein